MPSIHPEYEYDIFISYRHNDNQDGWVTRFVEALQKELRATLKNEVSIYFDENPHDGLLETHQVDASLAKKLKCLVFIPIVSQTYCDQNSFAWEHEFIPFLEMAKQNELGMNITLGNGNVVSRVLPVKIHELDDEDQYILEGVLDGPLRSIDFIYNEPGVNRPLKHTDERKLNTEKTDYPNQINKVANALKDIGTSILKQLEADGDGTQKKVRTVPRTNSIAAPKVRYKSKLVIPLALIVIIAIAYFWLKPFLFQGGVDKDISEVGLAIMPLKNISSEPEIDFLSFALKDEIHEVLALNKKFAFLSSSQATASYKDKEATPQIIGDELGVDYVLSGSYQISGDQLNVRVEFSDTQTGNSVWTKKFLVKYEEANIFPMQADIAQKVLAIFNEDSDNELQISNSINLESYDHYIKGLEWVNKGNKKETRVKAIEEFNQALALDSSHTQSWIQLIASKAVLIFTGQVSDTVYLPQIEEHIKAMANSNPQWSVDLANGIYQYHALSNYDKGFDYFKSVLEKYPDNEMANDQIANLYKRKLKNALSFKYRMKTINLNPKSSSYWIELGILFEINGDYKRALQCEEKSYELGMAINSYNYLSLMYRKALIPLDSMPKEYHIGNEKRFGYDKIAVLNDPRKLIELTKNIPLDTIPGPNNYTKSEYYVDLAGSYQALSLDDSARYYAELCLAENELKKEKDWVSILMSQLILGDLEEGDKIIANFSTTVETEDLWQKASRKMSKVVISAMAKEYEKSTEYLLELNKEFPEYGDYYILTRFIFDRAKKEYPPFAEAVANLKLPEPLVKDAQLERFNY